VTAHRDSDDRRRALGAAAEQSAAQCLERAGLAVVDRNVRLTGGEIDLVCRDGETWVFVEVKARRRGWDDAPGAAVSWQKQRRLAMLALRYLKNHGLREARCRFDVVEVTVDAGRLGAVRHLRSAFDAPAR
jgi:putative endonuclease